MKKLLGVVGVLILTIGAAMLWYEATHPTYSWRQKITISVATPTGLEVGSAVTGVEYVTRNYMGGYTHKTTGGEAAVVEVAPDKHLFALFSHTNRYGVVSPDYNDFIALTVLGGDNLGSEPVLAALRDRSGPAAGVLVVPTAMMPRLVTFLDIADPDSVREVGPSDLAATFGAGYTLESVTLELTDEPVSTGHVERLLQVWLGRRNADGRIPILRFPDRTDDPYGFVTHWEFFRPREARDR